MYHYIRNNNIVFEKSTVPEIYKIIHMLNLLQEEKKKSSKYIHRQSNSGLLIVSSML